MKKVFAGLLVLATFLPLHGDNLLSNGDFTDGVNHWEGDGAQGSISGLIVKLQPTWTKVYQDVTLPGNQATLSISYTVSPDATFSSTLQGVQQGPALGKLFGFSLAPGPITLRGSSWLILLVDEAGSFASYVNVTPQLGTDQVQTTGGTISHLKGGSAKTLYLVFPPGNGTITLQNVSVTAP